MFSCSLLIGSAVSYRHDSSLSPFPPHYINPSGVKDIKGKVYVNPNGTDAIHKVIFLRSIYSRSIMKCYLLGLRDALACIPPLVTLKRQLEQRSCQLLTKDLHLLLWVFNGGQSQLSLRTVPRSERIDVLAKAGMKTTTSLSLPTHIFQISNIHTHR